MEWPWTLLRTLKTQWRTTPAARPPLATLPARCSIKCKETEKGLWELDHGGKEASGLLLIHLSM
mgnify:FL=1